MSGVAAIPADDHPALREFPHPMSHPSTTKALEGWVVLVGILLALTRHLPPTFPPQPTPCR